MNFEWDDTKEAANLRKHGVSFEEAKGTIEHALAITVDDLAHSTKENREKTIGPSNRGRVLVVVHAKKSAGTIRIISARKASRRELVDYEKEIRYRLRES